MTEPDNTTAAAGGSPLERGVRPPTECSPDGREIWDWADRLSDRVAAVDKLLRLQKQAHTARTTCGSCKAWMTHGCPREVHDNRKGRSQGPSSMSVKCDSFAMTASDAASVAQAEAEIAALQQRLQAA